MSSGSAAPVRNPSAREVCDAARRIRPHVQWTPLQPGPRRTVAGGGEVLLKVETGQISRSFKYRGVVNAALAASTDPPPAGWVLASSGNFGIAVARWGGERGVPVTVFLPSDTPQYKRGLIESHGASTVAYSRHGLSNGQAEITRYIRERGGLAFSQLGSSGQVAAGHGTVAMEILQDCPDVDVIVVPIGTGGLATGVCAYVAEFAPQVRVVGVRAGGLREGFQALYDLSEPKTIAEGLRVGVPEHRARFLHTHLWDVLVVGDREILRSQTKLSDELGISIESTAAVAYAALEGGSLDASGLKVCVVVTGGNTAG